MCVTRVDGVCSTGAGEGVWRMCRVVYVRVWRVRVWCGAAALLFADSVWRVW
jgi:hypothetical protein